MDLNLCNFFCCWGNSFEQSIFKHLLFADFLLWNKKSSFRECFFNIFIASWIFFNSFLHSSHLFLPSRSIFFTFVSPLQFFPHTSPIIPISFSLYVYFPFSSRPHFVMSILLPFSWNPLSNSICSWNYKRNWSIKFFKS